MGHRLHTHIKHEIQYGTVEAFNYDVEIIDCIIHDLCEDFYDNGNDYLGSLPTDYEIEKEDFAKMIATLKDMTDEGFTEMYGKGINGDITREYVITSFENMLSECDTNNDYIYLSWF